VKPPAGPPWSVTDPDSQQTTDDERQKPVAITSLAPYIMYRRASNNNRFVAIITGELLLAGTPSIELDDFIAAKFSCPQALAGGRLGRQCY